MVTRTFWVTVSDFKYRELTCCDGVWHGTDHYGVVEETPGPSAKQLDILLMSGTFYEISDLVNYN